MALEDLARELKSIDPKAYADAFVRVSARHDMPGEGSLMFTSLAQEYPALTGAGMLAYVAEEVKDGDVIAREAAGMGAMLAILALKDMIEVAALNDIPTAE